MPSAFSLKVGEHHALSPSRSARISQSAGFLYEPCGLSNGIRYLELLALLKLLLSTRSPAKKGHLVLCSDRQLLGQLGGGIRPVAQVPADTAQDGNCQCILFHSGRISYSYRPMLQWSMPPFSSKFKKPSKLLLMLALAGILPQLTVLVGTVHHFKYALSP